MSQERAVEALISCEQSRTLQLMEEWNDFLVIFHPRHADFDTNLPKVYLPGCQLLPLAQADVLIQNIHDAGC